MKNITLKNIADKLSTMCYRVITVRDVIDMMIKDKLSGSLVAEVVEDKTTNSRQDYILKCPHRMPFEQCSENGSCDTNCEIREKFDKRLKIGKDHT